jgi:hypothetical protein
VGASARVTDGEYGRHRTVHRVFTSDGGALMASDVAVAAALQATTNGAAAVDAERCASGGGAAAVAVGQASGAGMGACLEDMWAGEHAVRVAGSYGTKVEAVVRRVMYVLQRDATAKVGKPVGTGSVIMCFFLWTAVLCAHFGTSAATVQVLLEKCTHAAHRPA